MVDDDPFAQSDNDRTVLKPTPGGRRAARSAPPSRAVPRASDSAGVGKLSVPGLNPLVDSAGALLQLASQLRNTARHADPSGLGYHIAAEIKRFEARARESGVAPEAVLAARYALCAFFDEIVLGTPWGAESEWSQNTLLTQFQGEAWGGEKFFAILQRLLNEPATNIDLLELMYLILALGFEGKYKVQNRGRASLDQLQDELYRTIRQHRGEYERELAPHWQGIGDLRNPLSRFVPLWVVAAVALAVLVTVFFGLRLSLGGSSEPAHEALRGVGRDAVPPVARQGAPRPAADLAQFLVEERRAGLVEVVDEPGRSTVTVLGQVYRSGSANVNARYQAVIGRIAAALQSVGGRVQVIGHTDSDPIPSSLRLKFPSNWELSQRRAESVRAMLVAAGLPEQLIEAEGLADSRPLAPNDTPVNKALNRRVEIVLIPSRRVY